MPRRPPRLVRAHSLGDAHLAHLQTCGLCLATTAQLARITDYAHNNALAPSPHLAGSLAMIVSGFSTHQPTPD